MKKLKVEFGSLFTDNTVYKVGDKEYTSLEDVPEEFRKILDKDGNGKVDFFEKDEGKSFSSNTRVFKYGDKEYTFLEDVPEEFRRFLDSDGNGKLDVFENRKSSGFFDSIETDELDESNIRVKYLGSDEDVKKSYVKTNLVNSKKTDVSLNPVRDGAIQRMPNNFEMNIWKLVWIACFAAGIGYFLGMSGLI